MLDVRRLTRPGLPTIGFSLAAGEAIAVSGPSGSGKTLLLRAIADLDPTAGEVQLRGTQREAMSGPAWRRTVAYMAAEPAWWADSVRVHFAEPDTALALFARLGLDRGMIDAAVARLSTGERQRLALARLLGRTPPPSVLLLDEPTAALDPEAAAAVEAVLRDRLNDGAAIVLASHDAALAGRLARRCVSMPAGTVGGTAAA